MSKKQFTVLEPTHRSCYSCKHLRREQSWEAPDEVYIYCNAPTGYDNLWTFPFDHTTCKKWEKKPDADT